MDSRHYNYRSLIAQSIKIFPRKKFINIKNEFKTTSINLIKFKS